MVTIELINEFHGTTARIRPRLDRTVSRRTERRVWRELCGMTDCGCGSVRGGRYYLTEIRDPWDQVEKFRVVDRNRTEGTRWR